MVEESTSGSRALISGKRERLAVWLPLTAVLILLCCGVMIKGPPADPDVYFGLSQVFGTFLVFMAIWVCALCWGYRLSVALGLLEIPNLGVWACSISLGTAFLSLLGALLGSLSLVGYSSGFLHLAILMLGPVIAGRGVLDQVSRAWKNRSIPGVLSLLVLCFFAVKLALIALRCGLAHGTTDPFMYHLLGPRAWSDRGEIYFRDGWPKTFLAASWEYLFFFGNSVLGGVEGKGLIEGQLFGQWTHSLLGFLGTAVALNALLKIWVEDRFSRWVAVVVATSVPDLMAYCWLAKNDFGILSWCVFSLAILFSPAALSRKALATAGVLLGLAISGKCVTVISLIPLLLVWAVVEIRRSGNGAGAKLATILELGLWIVLGALPVYLRNFYFTGNPFFPMLDSYFNNPFMSESLHVEQGMSTRPDKFSIAGTLLRTAADLRTHLPYFFAIACIPGIFLSRKMSLYFILALTSLLTILSFEAWHMQYSFLRWVGLSLVLVSAAGGLIFIQVPSRMLHRWNTISVFVGSLAGMLLLLYVGGDIYEQRNVWNTLVSGPPATLVIRNPAVNRGGDSKAWLRMNAKPGDLIATTGDDLLYYLSSLSVVPIREQPEMDFETRLLLDPREIVHVLRSFGVRYVLDVSHWEKRYFTLLAALLDDLSQEYPSSLAYVGTDSWVVDLEELERQTREQCWSDSDQRAQSPID